MSVADQEHAAPRFAPSLDALLHPVPLAALALLLVNDHVLKASHPGWLSGKLSDVAGLILLPFMLLAAWDLVRLVRPGPPAAGPRLAVGSVIAVVIAFTVIEVVPLGSDLYRVGLGSAQWPFRVFGALIASQPLPGLAPVQLTSDLSDLLALPAAITVLAVRPWRRRIEKGAGVAVGQTARGGASRSDGEGDRGRPGVSRPRQDGGQAPDQPDIKVRRKARPASRRSPRSPRRDAFARLGRCRRLSRRYEVSRRDFSCVGSVNQLTTSDQ
jgi:hypothetical protein